MGPATGRILIVDDEPPLLRMMSVYLTRLGFSVSTVDSTDEAWRMVKADPGVYSVAVLDGSMPGMTMPELAGNLLRANSQLCVLASSGYPVDISALEKSAPGRVSFLPKPFTPEMLAATVRRLLGSQEKNV
jgi:two-component system cell cycle sensor histidine kinase/response regulator CckA